MASMRGSSSASAWDHSVQFVSSEAMSWLDAYKMENDMTVFRKLLDLGKFGMSANYSFDGEFVV